MTQQSLERVHLVWTWPGISEWRRKRTSADTHHLHQQQTERAGPKPLHLLGLHTALGVPTCTGWIYTVGVFRVAVSAGRGHHCWPNIACRPLKVGSRFTLLLQYLLSQFRNRFVTPPPPRPPAVSWWWHQHSHWFFWFIQRKLDVTTLFIFSNICLSFKLKHLNSDTWNTNVTRHSTKKENSSLLLKEQPVTWRWRIFHFLKRKLWCLHWPWNQNVLTQKGKRHGPVQTNKFSYFHCTENQHVRDKSIHHNCVNTGCLCFGVLSEVLCRKHSLGAAQNGILGCIVWMLFGWDLQHSWNGLHVGVNGVTDHLCYELVDQDDADVVSRQEAPEGRKVEEKIQTDCNPGTINQTSFYFPPI